MLLSDQPNYLISAFWEFLKMQFEIVEVVLLLLLTVSW